GNLQAVVCTLSIALYGAPLEAFLFFSRTSQLQETPKSVRVLLDTLELPLRVPFMVSTSGVCMSISAGKKKPVIIKQNQLFVSVRRGALVLQGTPYSASVEISSDKTITYASKTYHGTLRLLVQGNSLLIINQVPLEQYISSVLKTESWP